MLELIQYGMLQFPAWASLLEFPMARMFWVNAFWHRNPAPAKCAVNVGATHMIPLADSIFDGTHPARIFRRANFGQAVTGSHFRFWS